jgi:hypothetical protein
LVYRIFLWSASSEIVKPTIGSNINAERTAIFDLAYLLARQEVMTDLSMSELHKQANPGEKNDNRV